MINSRLGSARFHFRASAAGGTGESGTRRCSGGGQVRNSGGLAHSRGTRGIGCRSLVGGMLGVATCVWLVGCASQEPVMPLPTEQKATVTIGADTDNPEQLVLAELYSQSFAKIGRASEIVGLNSASDRIDAVRSGRALVSFGCTGELLGLSDPAEAATLAREFRADKDPDKELNARWRDRVYDAFSKSLPGEMMATDAGIAQGCAAASESNVGAQLPQWLVPFYLKPALARADRVSVLNEIAGSLSTEDLQKMTDAVARGESAEEAARRWLDR